jgi:hypothetical protein
VAGRLNSQAARTGRGALADISAANLFVTGAPRGPAVAGEVLADGSVIREIGGRLVQCADATSSCLDGGSGRLSDIAPAFIDAGSLTRLNAESLLLGATREFALDGSLTRLNSESLLPGETREFASDGSVLIKTVAQRIVIGNDAANPLSAPEILLAVGFAQNDILFDRNANGFVVNARLTSDVRTGYQQTISLLPGASVLADGAVSDTATTDYIAAGGFSRAPPI